MIKLKGKTIDFLGRISYGMYVLHPFIILLTAIPLKYIIPAIHSKPLQLLCINAVVMAITILVAWVSFRYFESKFLKKKEQYNKVLSTTKDEDMLLKKKNAEAKALSL